jgi:hypothetical protein
LLINFELWNIFIFEIIFISLQVDSKLPIFEGGGSDDSSKCKTTAKSSNIRTNSSRQTGSYDLQNAEKQVCIYYYSRYYYNNCKLLQANETPNDGNLLAWQRATLLSSSSGVPMMNFDQRIHNTVSNIAQQCNDSSCDDDEEDEDAVPFIDKEEGKVLFCTFYFLLM